MSEMLELLQLVEISISELSNLVKSMIAASQIELKRRASNSHKTQLRWRRSDLKMQSGSSDPVRKKLEEFKLASSPSNPVCFRCGGRGHLARYRQNAPLCFVCNRMGHRSFQCRAHTMVDQVSSLVADQVSSSVTNQVSSTIADQVLSYVADKVESSEGVTKLDANLSDTDRVDSCVSLGKGHEPGTGTNHNTGTDSLGHVDEVVETGALAMMSALSVVDDDIVESNNVISTEHYRVGDEEKCKETIEVENEMRDTTDKNQLQIPNTDTDTIEMIENEFELFDDGEIVWLSSKVVMVNSRDAEKLLSCESLNDSEGNSKKYDIKAELEGVPNQNASEERSRKYDIKAELEGVSKDKGKKKLSGKSSFSSSLKPRRSSRLKIKGFCGGTKPHDTSRVESRHGEKQLTNNEETISNV